MRNLFLVLLLMGSLALNGQVIPSNFPVQTAPDTSNFEFYSQKGGNLYKTNQYYLAPYFEQSLSLSGDTLYISKQGTDGFVVLSPYEQTLSLDGSDLSISGGNTVTFPAGGSTQTLSVSNDSLTISGGNTIVLPRYATSDGSTITGDGAATALSIPTGGVTTTQILDGTIAEGDIANDAVTFDKLQNISTARLLGRSSTGTGSVEQLTIGSGLQLSGGVLSSTASGSAISYIDYVGGWKFVYQGTSPPIVTGTSGVYTVTIPSGTSLISFRVAGGSSLLSGGGDMSVTLTWSAGGVNSSVTDALFPAITIIETASANNVQLNNQGTGYQITHPTVGSGSTTSVITGLNGLGTFHIIGKVY